MRLASLRSSSRASSKPIGTIKSSRLLLYASPSLRSLPHALSNADRAWNVFHSANSANVGSIWFVRRVRRRASSSPPLRSAGSRASSDTLTKPSHEPLHSLSAIQLFPIIIRRRQITTYTLMLTVLRMVRVTEGVVIRSRGWMLVCVQALSIWIRWRLHIAWTLFSRRGRCRSRTGRTLENSGILDVDERLRNTVA